MRGEARRPGRRVTDLRRTEVPASVRHIVILQDCNWKTGQAIREDSIARQDQGSSCLRCASSMPDSWAGELAETRSAAWRGADGPARE